MKIEPAFLSLKRKSDEPGGSSPVPIKKPKSVEDGEEDLIRLHSLQITIPSSTALALTQPHHLMVTDTIYETHLHSRSFLYVLKKITLGFGFCCYFILFSDGFLGLLTSFLLDRALC